MSVPFIIYITPYASVTNQYVYSRKIEKKVTKIDYFLFVFAVVSDAIQDQSVLVRVCKSNDSTSGNLFFVCFLLVFLLSISKAINEK